MGFIIRFKMQVRGNFRWFHNILRIIGVSVISRFLTTYSTWLVGTLIVTEDVSSELTFSTVFRKVR